MKFILEAWNKKNLRMTDNVYWVLARCNAVYGVFKLALTLKTPGKASGIGPIL